MNLIDLIETSDHSVDCYTIQATVDTGFESIAERECYQKFGSNSVVCQARGRVYLNIRRDQYDMVRNLRSVNNVFLVARHFEDLPLSGEECDKDKDLEVIGNLVDNVKWMKGINAWQSIVSFHGQLYPTREQYKAEMNSMAVHRTILKYRVTCYRSGKHSFASQEAASIFGGVLQDLFNWMVDLSNYDLEIVLDIVGKSAMVLLAITESSLHRRNITHFGATTLKSTIAYGMLCMAEPLPGEVIMDPMCGCGSIPIECAATFPESYIICGDIQKKSVKFTQKNAFHVEEMSGKTAGIDIFHWNVTRLPLANSCVDAVVTDLPFGKRTGSRENNMTLYANALKELARVVVPINGRAVLLTSDKRSYVNMLRQNDSYWKQSQCRAIKMGGMKAFVFLLRRTCEIFKY